VVPLPLGAGLVGVVAAAPDDEAHVVSARRAEAV
jgi:hypothetical protein